MLYTGPRAGATTRPDAIADGLLVQGPDHAMTAISTSASAADFLRAVEVSPALIDDMSSIRHLHASSARRLAAGMLSETEIAAFVDHIYSEAYSSRVAEVVLARRLATARLHGELIGTAGWTPANDSGAVARLIAVFVSPLYAQRGIGKVLVQSAETQARAAGFSIFTMRAPLGASGFFERIGYDVASHGVWPLTRDAALPVAFLRKTDPVTTRPPLRAIDN